MLCEAELQQLRRRGLEQSARGLRRMARLEQRHAQALRAGGAPEWLAVEHDRRRETLLALLATTLRRLQDLDPS